MAARWPWPVQVTLQSGQSMYVDLRSTVGRTLFMQGKFDHGFFRPFEKALKKGDTFLDVGANVGYYSVLALQLVGSSGSVHAFEIDDRPLRCLRATIRKNEFGNLHLHETAIGDRSGYVNFYRDAEAGNSRVIGAQFAASTYVPMSTLDQWYMQSGRPVVRAIKFDIEGGELAALRGASCLLSEQHPLIVCEAWDGAGPQKSSAANYLVKMGYAVVALDNVDSPAFVARRLPIP